MVSVTANQIAKLVLTPKCLKLVNIQYNKPLRWKNDLEELEEVAMEERPNAAVGEDVEVFVLSYFFLIKKQHSLVRADKGKQFS